MSDASQQAIEWLRNRHDDRVKAGETPSVNAESLAEALALNIGDCRLIIRCLEGEGALRLLPTTEIEQHPYYGDIEIRWPPVRMRFFPASVKVTQPMMTTVIMLLHTSCIRTGELPPHNAQDFCSRRTRTDRRFGQKSRAETG